ncbi:hypothetical protein Tco_0282704 [Tanacetum coccineum]
MVQESLEDTVLAKESSQPRSSYEVAATLIEFELKKILIDKMDKKTEKKKIKMKTLSLELDQGLKKMKTGKDVALATEEPEFEVADLDMPQDQEENLGKDDEEPKKKVAFKHDWFIKPTQPQEPTDPDWNVDKTPQQGQNQSWLMTLASSAEKPSKTFDEMMRPAFRLLKGTRLNYAELEYDFEECYKALSEKLDWENPEGGDYPFDLTKPLPLVMSRNCQKLKLLMINLHYGESHIGENNISPSMGMHEACKSRHDVYSMKRILAVTQVEVIRKHGYGYLKEIVVRRADNDLYRFKEGDFLRLRINDIEDMLLLVVQNRLTNLSGDDVSDFTIALRMFTRSLNIRMEYLPKRRWGTLEKKRAYIMIKAIDKQLKERRLMRNLKMFVGGRDYKTDLQLLQ